MIQVFVDDQSIFVEKGSTVFQACDKAGIEIPRFCYHERLSIAGNCRMCLVEVEKSPKPVASCAMPVLEGMKIKTKTPLVKKAREGVLEFLLINHPLDCPICDQGGECDLQDLTMVYGSDRSRFHEMKRSVEDKNLGPLIKTIMTRCIHCTRCVRFATEVAGVQDIGTVGRGRETEISTYVEKLFDSELSGNVIDLCPVGALTSKPYAFTARPWELKSTETIDVTDSLGSNIRVDVRGSSILRILPKLNEEINEEWISDKTRFSYDGLQRQRLHHPMIRIGNNMKTVSWEEAFEKIAKTISNYSSHQIIGLLGSQLDVETALSVKEFLFRLGCHQIYFDQFYNGEVLKNQEYSDEFSHSFLLNQSIAGLEKVDNCLLIGVDPRFEATLVNTRLRKRYLQGNFRIASIGPHLDLTYPIQELGQDLDVLLQIAEGRHPFCKYLAKNKKSVIIVGNYINRMQSSQGIHSIIKQLAGGLKNLHSFNILHSFSGLTGYNELGITNHFLPHDFHLNNDKPKCLFIVGSDEINIRSTSDQFVIYIGHHGDKSAPIADIILPSATFIEKENSTYLNIEGRSQKTKLVFYPPANAREDWEILRALSEVLHRQLPYDTKEEVQLEVDRSYSPSISNEDKLNSLDILNIKTYPWKCQIKNQTINVDIRDDNYFHTDVVCRSSSIMSKCSKARYKKNK